MSARMPSRRLLTLTGLVLLLALAFGAATARAGTWMLVSCVNPDGSAAPSQNWSALSLGSPPLSSTASTRCSPQVPMEADLFSGQVVPSGSEEVLRFAPPGGSVLDGGRLQVGLYADGYGSGDASYTWGSAGVLEPGLAFQTGNIVLRCIQSQDLCQNGSDDWGGELTLPADAGGDLYVEADCSGFNTSAGQCDTGGSHDAWALAQVGSAQLLLGNRATPGAVAFGGSVLAAHASGAATLTFGATDAGGPGVYLVVVEVDGHAVDGATPDANDGKCRAVGHDASTGALMFDYAQPCPRSELVDATVPTTSFKDGRHTLTVTVIDAAGNSSEVLARAIQIRNSGKTGTRLRRLGLRMAVSWRWNGARTRLLRAVLERVPRGAAVSLACRGRGCPRGLGRLRGPARRELSRLGGKPFRAGDRVTMSFTAPGHRPERVSFTIRVNRLPRVRVSGG